MSNPINRMSVWISKDFQNPELGILPPNSFVVAAHLHVTEAFNSDGTDFIQCGYDADQDFVFANTDVSTTGVKSGGLGAASGYNSTARRLEVYYSNGGSEPTTGKAFVIVEYMRVSKQP